MFPSYRQFHLIFSENDQNINNYLPCFCFMKQHRIIQKTILIHVFNKNGYLPHKITIILGMWKHTLTCRIRCLYYKFGDVVLKSCVNIKINFINLFLLFCLVKRGTLSFFAFFVTFLIKNYEQLKKK